MSSTLHSFEGEKLRVSQILENGKENIDYIVRQTRETGQRGKMVRHVKQGGNNRFSNKLIGFERMGKGKCKGISRCLD
jgi:hypothetical protein